MYFIHDLDLTRYKKHKETKPIGRTGHSDAKPCPRYFHLIQNNERSSKVLIFQKGSLSLLMIPLGIYRYQDRYTGGVWFKWPANQSHLLNWQYIWGEGSKHGTLGLKKIGRNYRPELLLILPLPPHLQIFSQHKSTLLGVEYTIIARTVKGGRFCLRVSCPSYRFFVPSEVQV